MTKGHMNTTTTTVVPFTAHGYLEWIQAPGRGWAHGCTISRPREKDFPELGVRFTGATATANHNGLKDSIYVTDDGYIVEPCTGSYGEGIRWSISSRHNGLSNYLRHLGMVGTGVTFSTNLTEAAKVVAEARRISPDVTPRELEFTR